MLIRPMRESDVDAVAELARANFDGVMAEHHSPGVLADFRADVTPESFGEQLTWKRMFVVEKDGQLVATGGLADFGTPAHPQHTVSQFYVRADLHRRGIGRQLLDHLTILAAQADADTVHVPSSRNAIPFYERAGFVVDDLQPDTALEITWMTKPL